MFELQHDKETKFKISFEEYKKFRTMVRSLEEAYVLLTENNRSDFEKNRAVQFAIAMLLDVAGVQSFRLPGRIKRMFPAIPWHQIEGAKLRLSKGATIFDVTPIYSQIHNTVIAAFPAATTALEMLEPGERPEESFSAIQTADQKPSAEAFASIFKPSFMQQTQLRDRFSTNLLTRLASNSDPSFESLRSQMQVWFRNMSDEDRMRMHGRLQGSDEPHLSAFYELFFHEYFLRKGWNATKDPKFENKSPDFLVTHGTTKFIVESFTACSKGKHHESQYSFCNFLKALDRQENLPYVFEVHMHEWCENIESIALTNKSVDWVDSFAYPSTERRLVIDTHGFRGEIVAIPKSFVRGTRGSVIAWTIPEIDHLARMTRGLRAKCKNYQFIHELKVPFVLIACFKDNTDVDELAVLNRLYGGFELAARPNENCRVRILDSGTRRFCKSDKHTRVSAIITCVRTWRDGALKYDLRVFHNPWARRPLPTNLFTDFPQLVPDGNTIGELRWIDYHKRSFVFRG